MFVFKNLLTFILIVIGFFREDSFSGDVVSKRVCPFGRGETGWEGVGGH